MLGKDLGGKKFQETFEAILEIVGCFRKI